MYLSVSAFGSLGICRRVENGSGEDSPNEPDATDRRARCRLAPALRAGRRTCRAAIRHLYCRGASLSGAVYDLAEGRRNVSRAGAQSARRGFPGDDRAGERDRSGSRLVGRYRLSSYADHPLRAARRFDRHGVAELVRARWIELRRHSSPTNPAFPDSVVGIGKIVAENSATGSVVFDLSSLLSDNIDLRNVINDAIPPDKAYRLDPSLSYFDTVKAFPENDVITVGQTWATDAKPRDRYRARCAPHSDARRL